MCHLYAEWLQKMQQTSGDQSLTRKVEFHFQRSSQNLKNDSVAQVDTFCKPCCLQQLGVATPAIIFKKLKTRQKMNYLCKRDFRFTLAYSCFEEILAGVLTGLTLG